METEITYSQAYDELQKIVLELENSEINIDELDTKIQKASELMKICKEKLFSTEKNIKDILEEME